MPFAMFGRAGPRGGSAQKSVKKCGVEFDRRRKFRRELARLCRRWRNAKPRSKVPKKLIEDFKLEMNIA